VEERSLLLINEAASFVAVVSSQVPTVSNASHAVLGSMLKQGASSAVRATRDCMPTLPSNRNVKPVRWGALRQPVAPASVCCVERASLLMKLGHPLARFVLRELTK